MEIFELDKDDDYDGLCGEIYLTLKKYLIFHCLLCDRKFNKGLNYLWHAIKEHGICSQERNVDGNINERNIMLLPQPSFESVYIQDQNQKTPETGHFSNGILIDKSLSFKSIECFASHKKSKKTVSERKSTSSRNKPDSSEAAQQSTASRAKSKNNIIERVNQAQISFKDSTRKTNISEQEQNLCVSPPQIAIARTLFVLTPTQINNDPTINNESTSLQKQEEKVLKTYKCQCTFACTSRQKYRKHIQDHKPTYKCPICCEVFKYFSTYTKHLNEHNDIKDKFHRCETCSKGFPTHGELVTHDALHTDEQKAAAAKQAYERPYKCPICGFRMKDSANILSHMRRHSDNNRKHECPDCSKKFFTRTELQTHSRQHTGERPFLCSECGESFTTIGILSMHRRKRHITRERKYKCTMCSSSFFDKSYLRNHLCIHQDERKYACNYCSATFKRQKGLSSHIKIHKNELNYKCNVCEKRFNQGPALSSHMKTHNKLNFNKL